MSAWSLEFPAGAFFLDFAWMGVFVVAAVWLRRQVGLIQDYLIPVNLLAGMLALACGSNGFAWIDLDGDRLAVYVYHLLALLFIALGLRSPEQGKGRNPVIFGLLFIFSYLIQGLVGLGIAYALIATIMPDLFAGIGLLMPLAFGMNPGIAYSIGSNWESHGFPDGGIVGLTLAAIGFLVAYGVGIAYLRRGIAAGQATYLDADTAAGRELRTGLIAPGGRPHGGHLTTAPESLESLTFHAGLVGLTYVVTWVLLTGAERLLVAAGAGQEIPTLWSFHFIAAAVVAMGMRRLLDATRAGTYVDDPTMTRIANVSMDLMVVASVAAISFAVVAAYWLPILLMSVAVTVATVCTLRIAINGLFTDHRLERFLAVFGNMTGTMQSALVLLRVLDPRLKSPVSHDLVYGSGLALVLGFPLLVLINAPVNYFEDPSAGFAYVGLALAVYLLLIGLALRWMAGK